MSTIEFAISGLTLVLIGAIALDWLRTERADRARRAAAREHFNRRPKAPILKVGKIHREPGGRVVLEDWFFDYSVPVPIHYAIHDGTTVHTVMLGYTEDELLYIADHPAEFEESAR